MANGTTRFIQTTNTICKGYLFTIPKLLVIKLLQAELEYAPTAGMLASCRHFDVEYPQHEKLTRTFTGTSGDRSRLQFPIGFHNPNDAHMQRPALLWRALPGRRVGQGAIAGIYRNSNNGRIANLPYPALE